MRKLPPTLQLFQNVLLLLVVLPLDVTGATVTLAASTLPTTTSKQNVSSVTCRGSTNLEHLTGRCMFHYECVQRKGLSIGPCFANHIVGSCCMPAAAAASRADDSPPITATTIADRTKPTIRVDSNEKATTLTLSPTPTTPITTRSQLSDTTLPVTTTKVNSIILSKLKPGTGIVVKDETQFYEIISSNTRKTTTTGKPKALTTLAANVTKSGALVDLGSSTNGLFPGFEHASTQMHTLGTAGWFQPAPIPGTPGHPSIPNVHVEDIFSNHFPVALPMPSSTAPPAINHYPTMGSLLPPAPTTPSPVPQHPQHPPVVHPPHQPSVPPTPASPQDIANPGKYTCGIRPLRPTGRVVGGRNAAFGEWPWQVLIKESGWLGLFMKPKCGGVLIDDRWVLTAAHCQPGTMGSLLVMLGQHESNPDNQQLKPVVKTVRRMIVHRDYNPETFDNDIALLELDTPFELKPHVVPICLPDTDYHLVGEFAHVAGFGKLSYGGQMPAILQTVKLPIIDNAQCQKMFADAGHFKYIRDSFLCAGYLQGGKDTCEGDSGGPLMVEKNGIWTLVGTVSHGIKCAEPNMPGVYMKTYAYLNWIRGIIGHK